MTAFFQKQRFGFNLLYIINLGSSVLFANNHIIWIGGLSLDDYEMFLWFIIGQYPPRLGFEQALYYCQWKDVLWSVARNEKGSQRMDWILSYCYGNNLELPKMYCILNFFLLRPILLPVCYFHVRLCNS